MSQRIVTRGSIYSYLSLSRNQCRKRANRRILCRQSVKTSASMHLPVSTRRIYPTNPSVSLNLVGAKSRHALKEKKEKKKVEEKREKKNIRGERERERLNNSFPSFSLPSFLSFFLSFFLSCRRSALV